MKVAEQELHVLQKASGLKSQRGTKILIEPEKIVEMMLHVDLIILQCEKEPRQLTISLLNPEGQLKAKVTHRPQVLEVENLLGIVVLLLPQDQGNHLKAEATPRLQNHLKAEVILLLQDLQVAPGVLHQYPPDLHPDLLQDLLHLALLLQDPAQEAVLHHQDPQEVQVDKAGNSRKQHFLLFS